MLSIATVNYYSHTRSICAIEAKVGIMIFMIVVAIYLPSLWESRFEHAFEAACR